MSYDIKKHAATLELNDILVKLANEANTEDAKNNALLIVPENELEAVKTSLEHTDAAYTLIAKYTSPFFGNIKNVSSLLQKASLGASLSAGELLQIADVLRITRTTKSWRDNSDSAKETAIDYLFSQLVPNKFLEDKINFSIKSAEEINDNASSTLSDLRRKISSKSSKIRELLDKIIHGNLSKYLQETIVTQRDGRFVVPVRAEHKGQIPGIVHDTSSSGSTFFIEPMSVVETNNEIRVLKAKEQEEILRILAELSALCADFKDTILSSYKSIVKLDLIFAKAKLAFKMAAVLPKINADGYIYLKNARHPMISHKKVVPITIELGSKYDTLVVTGPNTGGKTVALKTVGLLSLMAMCGLMIPADENSEICVFNKVFADIGDEQSITQSLSTFSSHMTNIISIIEQADENTLVLFDELCAGTDPIEGAALAKSILITLTSKGVKSVVTTHYPELKAYAIDTERVENASCEFDVATLKPTYNLIVGQPGRSNAFAISKRLGLDEQIINLATEQLSDKDLHFERVVASLEKARQSAEQQLKEVSKMKLEISLSKKKTQEAEYQLKVKQEKLFEQTREKAAGIIEVARYKSSQLLNELEELKKKINSDNAATSLDIARQNFKKTLQEIDDISNPVVKNELNGQKLAKMPNINDIVVISSLNKDATVINLDEKNKRVFVVSGSIKMWVDFDDLRIKKSNNSTEIKKTRNISGITSREQRSISGEIDIRGLASDEALFELDSYIDNAILSGMGSITVIHGKGTGVLRKKVQSYLRSHKYIKSFRDGLYGEGENGVTIAELVQ